MAGVVFPRIADKMADLGSPAVRVAEKLGIRVQTLTNKLCGISGFTADEVKTLAEWWGCSTDDLLCERVILEDKGDKDDRVQ